MRGAGPAWRSFNGQDPEAGDRLPEKAETGTCQALGPAAGVGGIRRRPDGSWGRVRGCLGWGPRETGRCPRLQAGLGCAPGEGWGEGQGED